MRYLSWDNYVRLALSYVVFEQNRDGTWMVEVPILPGCVTWGETREEASEMAEDAVKGWILTALRFGDEIPVIDGCTRHPQTGMKISVPIHKGRDIPVGTLRAIVRQLGISVEEWSKL